MKYTSVLRVDYVTPDPYPRQSDVELQVYVEGWDGCGKDLITEVDIIGT